MRRASGVVLAGLAVFSVVLAILLPTYAVNGAKKTPLDLNITQKSTATNAKVLDGTTNQLKTATLRATRIVRTDSGPNGSNDKDTTVDESLCVVIVQGPTPNCVPSSDPRLLSVTTDRVTADRVSAESVHVAKFNENVNGQPVRHVGLSYKWPIDTVKKTYQFYFPDLLKAFPATYEGTDRVGGLETYKFVSKTGVQKYLVSGIFPGTYDDVTTAWVEPKTGAVIYGEDHQIQKLADGTLALDANFKFDKSAVDYQANYSKDAIKKIDAAQIWGPIGLGVLAVICLVGAYFLLRSRRTPGGSDPQGLGRQTGPAPDEGPDYAEPPVGAGTG